MLKISKTTLLYGKTIITFCCKNIFIFVEIFVEADEKPISISTHPIFLKNVVATNFSNLQLISSINYTSNMTCYWYVIADFSAIETFFENGCSKYMPNDIYRSTCEIVDNFIKYNFTYLLPIRTNYYFEVGCYLINGSNQWNFIILSIQGKKNHR